ncbi:MAG: DUF5686 and carboxypeptidase regulatory-like domain-containing protein [Bacteroides sp.]|nr:DUF5686 and carboxypeptidase regulatory-like domain-containing protein [Bacteroides sp.]
MRLKLIFFLFCIGSLHINAQVFKGQVTSETGEPIPFASIYIKELTSGFITDDAGYFQTILPVGNYTCEISSLGYSQQVISVQIPSGGLEKNITLTERVYELREVNITRDNEDPAYSVMRQAIARAPFYQTYVRNYTADVYMKGTGKLNRIPAILKISKEIREDAKKYMGKLFVMEEKRKVTYTAPNKWENEIVAYTNSFPEEIQIKIQTTDINLYQPKIFGKISPLSPGAFSYYQYKLEGYFEQGEYMINRIKIIPKKGNSELISGYLYIVQGLWSLSAVDVALKQGGVDATVKISCNEVKPSTFLTTSISLTTSLSTMGLKAEASYLSSIQYSQVQVGKNPLVTNNQQPTVTIEEETPPQLTSKQRKNREKMNDLLKKEELTTREAYQLSNLVSKSIQEADTNNRRNKFERRTREYIEKKDSLADSRDSAYWAQVRTIPLRPEEMESYTYKEQLNPLQESSGQQSARKQPVGDFIVQTLLSGRTVYTQDKKAWLTFGPLSSFLPEFNYVDGLWIGAKVKSGFKLNEKATLHFTPEAYYAASREDLIWKGELSLNYAPHRLGHLYLKAGSTSADFNGESGESRMINGFASLWFGRNDMKLYKSFYVNLGNEIELSNALQLSLDAFFEKGSTLENARNKGWFGVKAKPNIPRNDAYEEMFENGFLKLSASLTYTPGRYYYMYGGKKYYENSLYPTFSLRYQQGFTRKALEKVSPSYHRTEITIHQKIDFGLFNTFSWRVNAGAFLDVKEMRFQDFKHFATTRIPVTEHSLDENFSLLDNYAYSTHKRWAQVNLSWRTPYLLIKQLPFLEDKKFDEALHLRTLAVFQKNLYTEIGYSVGLSTFARLGIFAGFDRLRYKSVGVSLSLPILDMIRP